VEAYQVSRINLLREAEIPSDASMLIFCSPTRPHPGGGKLHREIPGRRGKAIFLLDVLPVSAKLTNLQAVLAEFGVGFVNNFTIEDNPRYYYSNNKLNVIPAMGLHEITQALLERKCT